MSILRYDVDSITWNPQGKIQQVDYALEAVKQGSICLAIRSDTEAVLVSVKKNPTKLACHQEKIFKISDTIGIGISGMTGDARMLCKYMRFANAKHQIKYNDNINASSLANKVAKKAHEKTYVYGKRPFGVAILMVGYNKEVPRVYEISPSGEHIEYDAFAIGAKSQSSKTYLEKHMGTFKKSSTENLMLHALNAIKAGYRDEPEDMSEKNIEVSLLSHKHGFQSLTRENVKGLLEKLTDFKPENLMNIEG
jgi:20S proteasome subunit alpha 6